MRSEKKNIEQDLDKIIQSINKGFGEGSVRSMDKLDVLEVPVYSSGSFELDDALGIRGVPQGRVMEVFGAESSGKTTACLMMAIEVQKQGGKVAFIDVEHALDINWFVQLGGKTRNNFYLSQPNNAEEALEIAYKLAKSQHFALIILDSVAALVSQAEIDNPIGSHTIGIQSRLMSQALRKFTPICHSTNTSMVFINQIRMKVGVMFGNPEVTSGGLALKFYSSIRIETRRGQSILEANGKTIGHIIKFKVVKNKLAPPHRLAEYELYYYDTTPSPYIRDMFNFAVKKEIIQQNGGWYKYNDKQLAHGKDKALLIISQDENIQSEILAKLNSL